MRRRFCLLLVVSWFVLGPLGALQAENTWCSEGGQSIFCFDFDRNCSSPPPEPEKCPDGTPRLDSPMRAVWVYNSWNVNTQSACGSNMTTEEVPSSPPVSPYGYILPSHPYGGRHANGGDESGQLGQNTVDLLPYIQDAIPGNSLVNGSDDQPLVLTFTMGSLALGAMQFNNGYMELSLNDPTRWNSVDEVAKAPTDFVLVGGDDGAGCPTCNSTCTGGSASLSMVAWPTVCQQEFPNPLCPPKQTLVRNAIAIGALALLDNNPCHCCTELPVANPNQPWRRQCVAAERTPDFPDGWQEPTNMHLSYFDGLEWRVLRQGMGGPGSYGDFRYGNYWIYLRNNQGVVVGNTDSGWETVVLTLKTSTVDIYHKTKMMSQVDGQWVETWTESLAKDLPRRYTGSFNRLRAGTDESCQLRHDSYTCDPSYSNGHRRCKVMKEGRCDGGNATYRSSYVAFDNVKLAGGVGGVGPCCLPDASCSFMRSADCLAAGGTFRGGSTGCDGDTCLGACCEPQNTCTQTTVTACQGRFAGVGVPCQGIVCCPTPFADFDGDGDVDAEDFAVLQVCYTGDQAGVAARCTCFDHNGDHRIDQADITSFVACATGPGITATASPQCVP
jgi:hypothetical protein